MSSSEEIRAKRLARLGNDRSPSSAQPIEPQLAVAMEIDPITNDKGEEPMKTTLPTLDKAVAMTSSKPQPSPSPSRSPSPRTHKSPEVQEHILICTLLRITLVPASGQEWDVLEELADELSREQDKVPSDITLNVQDIDRALVAKLSLGHVRPNEDQFGYLLQGYKRACDGMRQKIMGPVAVKVCTKVKELTVSYSGIMLQYPDVFTQNRRVLKNRIRQLLDPILAASTNNNAGLPDGFLSDFVIRYHNDDGADEIFLPLFKEIEKEMRQVTLIDNFLPPLQAMVELLSHKQLVPFVIRLPNWLPVTTDPLHFEDNAFLASFFVPSSFPDDNEAIAKAFFDKPTARTQQDIELTIQSVRKTLEPLQRFQFQIVRALLAVADAREPVLQFIAKALSINKKRPQQHRARTIKVSTHGFLINLTKCLLSLCDPFMGAKSQKLFSKMDDCDYYSSPVSRICLETETRMSATEQEGKDYMEGLKAKPYEKPHFVVECFYLTIYALHVGFIRSCLSYEDLHKELREMQTYYKNLKDTRHLWMQNPAEKIRNEIMLQRIQTGIELFIRNKFTYDVQMLDPTLLEHIVQFYQTVSVWLTSLIDPTRKGPPLDAPTQSFVMLPELVLEDIGQYFVYLSRFSFRSIESEPMGDVVELMVELISSPEYVKNPYLRANFVEVMYMMTPAVQQTNTQFMYAMEHHKLAIRCLVSSLRNFWSEVQSTGAHTQFYDKFNIRYHIAIILKELWTYPEHRQRMIDQSKDTDHFMKFVNHLVMDTTYLLDESLSHLITIRDIEQLKRHPEEWNKLSPQEQQEKEKTYEQSSKVCKSLHMLAIETVSMFHYLSEVIIDPFLRPELVERLANMMDYHLGQLAGPKCQTLKVENPDKYNFNPKSLLNNLTDIYLHLVFAKDRPAPTIEHPLIQAMAKDGRSFKPDTFMNAVRILRRLGIKEEERIKQFETMIKLVQQCISQGEEAEEELGEIPDEFLDPLMWTLMTDPVILSTSNQIVDRKTIETQLLTEEFDPFNRAKLTVDMLVPAVELKAKIDTWLTERKAQILSQKLKEL